MNTQVASVSSASQPDEESASESSTEVRVQRVVPAHPTTFDQPSLAPSPNPIPIQGGEDEVIQVSAVRKIKVNITESQAKSRLSSQSIESPPTGIDEEQHQVNHSNEETQQHRQQPPMAARIKRDPDWVEGDSQTSPSDSEPMDVIEKSPYENNMDAEKGEELFMRMKNALKECDNGDDYRTVHEEATKIFGPTNAWCLVKANGLIEKSGMVYSQEWCTGNIRGNQIGRIPKDLLLLCLVSKRFAKAQDQLLSGLTRDFEIATIVHQAVLAWKFPPNKYRQILATAKSYQFVARRRDCYKAAIFVARAFSCYKAFVSEGPLQPSLKTKVVACLDLMEQHLAPTAPTSKKRKMEPDATTIVDVTRSAPTNPDPIPKRRGRPRKGAPESSLPDEDSRGKPVDTLVSQTQDNEDESRPANKKPRRSNASASKPVLSATRSDVDVEDDEDDMIPYNPPIRGKNRATKTSTTTNKAVKLSLSALVSKFEDQYEAMGKMYQQLGDTIQELKSCIQENRTVTEQELRNELLQEVQNTLAKSFGKKSTGK